MPTTALPEQWISFRLHRETYAQRIASVKEVIDYRTPVPVPGAPGGVEGVLNIRGEVITVISGHHLVEAPLPDEREALRIVIVEGTEERIGVVVDAVEEIVTLPSEAIEPVDDALRTTLMLGTARRQEQLLILVDLAAGCAAAAAGVTG